MATVAAPPAPRRRPRSAPTRKNVFVYLGLTFYAILAGFPVYWMVLTTFKRDSDLYTLKGVPLWFNEPPTLEHLDLLFHRTQFTTWLTNTMGVALGVSIITLLVGVPAGYALARLRFPGAETVSIGIFMTYLIPSTLLFIPLSRVVSSFGLYDRTWSLVLVYPTFTIPFCTWLLSGFFKTIPNEIEEAAMVDGCSRLGAIRRVVLPLSLAGMLTAVIFAFTLSMQDFVYALTFISPSDQKPVTVGVVSELIRGDVFFWGSLMAGALLAGVPVAIIYSFFLDYFVKGITGGAVK
jgi:multiple sugar transport system permease protein